MGRFLIFPCLPSSSKHSKLTKATSSSSFKTLVSKLRFYGEDQGSGKLGVLVELESAKEREDEKNKESGKLGVLVQIETENERNEAKQNDLGVHVETENESGAISDSTVSSYISYPPMHRYHNGVTHEDEEYVLVQADSPESLFSLSVDPTRQSKSSPVGADDKEVIVNNHDHDKSIDSLLNPIENLADRKTMKARSPMSGLNHLQEKENLSLEQENSKVSDRKERLENNNVVAASLASWLVKPEKSATPSKEESQTSWKSIEDRPILGAWSIDEVKQVSARSTPRKSPCHNPDDTPIIGTVGSYWIHTGQDTDSAKSTRNRKNNVLSCHSSSKRRLERAFDKSDV
ncbi:uncharacterized protein LOC143535566 [Bidens hawaiensis]|uniref:uncharacterized protein LOC143535566 n=1 Tax=Bidens hawaiensis TaxID=980011 RepID=UPI00404B4885